MNRLRKQTGTTEHQRIKEQLSAYLDGQLSGPERQAVQRHLATCEQCRWNLETLKLTVQWTRELPSVPIPRVFTVPAPAQPVRMRQSWSVPLLQGATALVALLLVFAFVGDFALTGLAPAKAPDPVALLEQQAVDVVVTQVVEAEPTMLLEMEAASLPAEAETKVVAEEVVAAKAAAEAPAPPAADVAAATEAAVEAAPPAATPAPEARGLGAVGFGAPTETPLTAEGGGETGQEEPLATVAPEGLGGSEAVSPTYAAELTSTAAAASAVEATPTQVAALAPELPQAVAEAAEPQVLTAPDTAEQGRQSAPALYEWLRPAEVALGVLFIFLAAATVVVMVQRRPSR